MAEIDQNSGGMRVPYLNFELATIESARAEIASNYGADSDRVSRDYLRLCGLFPDFHHPSATKSEITTVLEYERAELGDQIANYFWAEVEAMHPGTASDKSDDLSALEMRAVGLASVAFMRNALFVDRCINLSKEQQLMQFSTGMLQQVEIRDLFPEGITVEYLRYKAIIPDLFRIINENVVSETSDITTEIDESAGLEYEDDRRRPKFENGIEREMGRVFLRSACVLLRREELTYQVNFLDFDTDRPS